MTHRTQVPWTVAIVEVLSIAVFQLVGFILATIGLAVAYFIDHRLHPRADRPLAEFSARSLTSVAALLAGREGPALRDEWRAHLGGASGHDPVTWPKVSQALGFVAAAVRVRLAAIAELAWRPADAVLGSRTLSNLFVCGPVTVMLVAIVHHDGRFGLVADVQDPAALGAFLYGVIRTGRWWRGVKPPEPKARCAKE
jgi:hypothetical protein